MFIRIKSTTRSQKRSVQIVESEHGNREGRQRIVRHIGVAYEADELEKLKDLTELVKAKLEEEIQSKYRSIVKYPRNRP